MHFRYFTLILYLSCPKGLLPQGPTSIDSVLFRAALEALTDSSDSSGELTADPRILSPDAGIVTLHSALEREVITARSIGENTYRDTSEGALERARRAVMSDLKIAQTNAWADAKCPGVLTPPTEDVVARKRAHCPSVSKRSAIISSVRNGGAYWPGEVDERRKYSGKVVSLRVILRTVQASGSTESAWDFVFLADSQGAWRLVERRLLLNVE